MKGYVKNVSAGWIHIFKQGLGPNCVIQLDTLYEIYGNKNGLKEGDSFVQWLRDVKLKNRADCTLVYEAGKTTVSKQVVTEKQAEIVSPISSEEVEESSAVVEAPVIKPKVKPVSDDITAITSLTVHKAKPALARISNLSVLKTALKQARQMPNRDTLCRLIDKRILELEQYF